MARFLTLQGLKMKKNEEDLEKIKYHMNEFFRLHQAGLDRIRMVNAIYDKIYKKLHAQNKTAHGINKANSDELPVTICPLSAESVQIASKEEKNEN